MKIRWFRQVKDGNGNVTDDGLKYEPEYDANNNWPEHYVFLASMRSHNKNILQDFTKNSVRRSTTNEFMIDPNQKQRCVALIQRDYVSLHHIFGDDDSDDDQ